MIGDRDARAGVPRGSAREVLGAFLKLGLTSFGGPIAHLGYFRTEFIERRGWLDERTYADLVALAQFLPGPASSQVGMAVGLLRAGYAGVLAAWAAFTLPSALAMVLFAFGIATLGVDSTSAWLHGMKVAAVAVVANAVLGMARTLAPDKERVFREAYRVLKPGGRMQISDIVTRGALPENLRRDMEQWAGCVAGALDREEYLKRIQDAGFSRVDLAEEHAYQAGGAASFAVLSISVVATK